MLNLQEVLHLVADDHNLAELNPANMRPFLFFAGLTLLTSPTRAQWAFGWARQSSSDHIEHGTSCAVAPDGHVAVTGSFNVETQLGTLTFNVAPGNGNGGFVADYDLTGNLEWAHAFSFYHPSGGNADCKDVAVDGAGNVFAAGVFADSLFMDGVKILDAPDSIPSGAGVYYVAKFNPSGNLQWAAPIGVGGYTGTLLAIAVDGNGDVYTTGSDGGQIGRFDKLDGTTGANLLHYSTSGAGAYINDVAVDAANNVYIVGQAGNAFTMGGLTCPYNNALGGGSTPLFVGKFNSAGDAQWYFVPDQAGQGFGVNHVTASADGTVFVETLKHVVVGTDTLNTAENLRALFSLDTDGNVRWARQLDLTPSNLTVNALHCDSEGNVLAAGTTNGAMVDLIDTTLYSQVNFNVFLGRYDANTAALTGLLSGPSVVEVTGLDFGSDDVPVFCGTFAGGPVDLGDVLNGSWDMFVAKLQFQGVGIISLPVAEAGDLTLIPNPTTDHFILRMDRAVPPLQVKVLDDHGAVVMDHAYDTTGPTIDIGVRAGLYLLRATDATGRVAKAKLVVD